MLPSHTGTEALTQFGFTIPASLIRTREVTHILHALRHKPRSPPKNRAQGNAFHTQLSTSDRDPKAKLCQRARFYTHRADHPPAEDRNKPWGIKWHTTPPPGLHLWKVNHKSAQLDQKNGTFSWKACDVRWSSGNFLPIHLPPVTAPRPSLRGADHHRQGVPHQTQPARPSDAAVRREGAPATRHQGVLLDLYTFVWSAGSQTTLARCLNLTCQMKSLRTQNAARWKALQNIIEWNFWVFMDSSRSVVTGMENHTATPSFETSSWECAMSTFRRVFKEIQPRV